MVAKKPAGKKKEPFHACSLRELPEADRIVAAKMACEINPGNAPRMDALPVLMTAFISDPAHLAVLTTKYWGARGVELSVSFMENTATDLRDRILSHMNAWGEWCQAKFRWSQSAGQVRISRGGGGYYSYLGTDVLQIPRGQQTMNLQGFTMNTSEAEYKRVVRHETGHTLGFPHEHMRAELIARLDTEKTVSYFARTQGWSRQQTMQQVLTPLEESSIMGSPGGGDQTSIMTYQLPGEITKDGRPIVGGNDLDPTDKTWSARLYPKADAPPPSEVEEVFIPRAGKWVYKGAS